MAAARLIRQLYDSSGNEALKASLERVTTGSDRLGAAVDHTFTLFAHKTGSGYRDDAGRLIAEISRIVAREAQR